MRPFELQFFDCILNKYASTPTPYADTFIYFEFSLKDNTVKTETLIRRTSIHHQITTITKLASSTEHSHF